MAADRSFTNRDIESGAMQLNTEVCHIGKLSRRGFYLAFQNSGACVAMVSVRVYYKTCPEAVQGLARFPETLAGLEGLTEVPGVCVEYAAEETGSPPRMHCSTDGEWLVPMGRCLCAVGFEEVDGSCVGEYADSGCRPWERLQGAGDQGICKHKVRVGELVCPTSLLPALCACQAFLMPFLHSIASFPIVIFSLCVKCKTCTHLSTPSWASSRSLQLYS